MPFFPSSKPQRTASLSLLIVCWIYLVYQLFNPSVPRIVSHDNHGFQPIYNEPKTEKIADKEKSKPKPRSSILAPEPFDPNTVSLEKMLKIGIPAHTAKTIVKYRDKGGFFKKPSDLKRIYTLDSTLYIAIEPYIRIEYTPKNEKKPSFSPTKPEKYATSKPTVVSYEAPAKTPVCINTASDSLLRTVRGIGPYYAKKIISFREKAGGFYAIEQLKDIPKMDTSQFAAIAEQVAIHQGITKVLLDEQVSFKKVNALIGYEHTKLLFRYIQQHGAINYEVDLDDIVWMSEEEKKILQKYFLFE